MKLKDLQIGRFDIYEYITGSQNTSSVGDVFVNEMCVEENPQIGVEDSMHCL